MKRYAFANILLSGPCNFKCPFCIGQTMASRQLPRNLDRFPLAGLDEFVSVLNRSGTTQVSLTGTNTEPQLYRHEQELINYLRQHVPGVKISLHTNGSMALKKMTVFTQYDRATISFPSFDPDTFEKITGTRQMIHLPEIVRRATLPLKISTIVTPDNLAEIPAIIQGCRELGINRMVLRKQYKESEDVDLFPLHEPVRSFGGNPVYQVNGMEITVWDFSRSELNCLNLFSDGTITDVYEIAEEKTR